MTSCRTTNNLTMKRETHGKNCNKVMNKERVLAILETMGIESYTPVRVLDNVDTN